MLHKYRLMTWTPERIARFWDWQSNFPENYFTYQFGDRIVAAFRPYLKPETRVLDLGCGTGSLLPHLAHHSQSVTGADPSGNSVKHANMHLAGTKGFQGAFTLDELVARREKYDTIFVVEVIEHIDDSSFSSLVSTIHSVLSKNGRVIFTTPNNENLEESFIYCPESDAVFHKWQHIRSWNSETLTKRITDENFLVERIIETDLSLRPLWSFKGIAQRALRRFLNHTAPPPSLHRSPGRTGKGELGSI